MVNSGAEIQPDNNWTKVHNSILELLASTNFTARELRCLLFLLRKTYGFQCREAAISLNDWTDGTKLKRPHVFATLQELANRNVITKTETGKRSAPIWAFNKYFEQWIPSTPKGTTFNGTHMGTTDSTQEGTSTGTQEGTLGSTPVQSTSTPIKEGRKQKKIIDEPTPEPKAPTPQQEYFGAVCACVGWDYRTITKEQTGQVAQTVGVLQDAKYTIDDLREFWRWWRKNDWRGQKGQYPTLQQLRSEIGKIRVQAESFVPPTSNGGGSTRYGVKDLSHG